MKSAESWKEEVHSIFVENSSSSSTTVGESGGGGGGSSGKTVSLRRVEALLVQGEHFPFDLEHVSGVDVFVNLFFCSFYFFFLLWCLTLLHHHRCDFQDLDLLREKKSQARVWLERLKKSFQTKTAGRQSSLRKIGADGGTGSSNGNGSGDRLCLADMKLMVQEGELLLDGDANEGAVGRSGAQFRELSKAQTVVDLAEEVLSSFFSMIIFLSFLR